MKPMDIEGRGRDTERIERFVYPPMPSSPFASGIFGILESSRDEDSSETADDGLGVQSNIHSAEKLAEETRRAFAGGRERGLAEGRQLEREAQAAALRTAEEHRTRQFTQFIEQFSQERDRYLHAVEKEVVKLALAIAARILRREAQMDPLLLSGAVRVALGQLSGSTEVRLRVPASELDLWKDAVALLPNLAVKPQVMAGDGMRLGDCVVETALGSVDLGIRSQLGEIERGFFDSAAMNKKPSPRAEYIAEAVGPTA